MSRSATDSIRTPIPYRHAYELQQQLVERRSHGDVGDVLWLLEHPPTVTLGCRGGESNLLLPLGEYDARGIAVCETDRGGDVTYHEPGQMVGYPIVQLRDGEERDLHRYLSQVETAIMDALRQLGLESLRVRGRTGVWLAEPARKLVAIGVRAKRWVTSHGFAMNVDNALSGFQTIVPCGIKNASVTNLARELRDGGLPTWQELCSLVHVSFENVLDRPLRLLLGRNAFDLCSTADAGGGAG